MNADTQIAQEMVSIQDPQVTTLPTDSGVDSSGDLHEPIVDDAASPMEIDSANTNDPRVSESEKSEKDVPIGSEENDAREIKSEDILTDKDDDSSQLKEKVHSGCATQVLHTDLARPLSVGNRVIAKIGDVDHNKSNVLFDELGVELVMDIDSMSLNPLEYMPEGLRKQFENSLSISKEARINRHSDASVLSSPALLEIVNGSKSIAQAMVNAAIKAVSSANMAQLASGSIDNSIVPSLKYQEHTNGSLDHHSSKTAESMTNSFISQGESEKDKTDRPTELITSCVATFVMIEMCLGNQYPPTDVAQLMDRAVSELEPMYPQNMPIYREIQKCMGCIKTQIMALVKNMKA